MEDTSAAIRLKHFMEFAGLSNSQFADSCGIPRPTLSQLLSGRNKKLSDQIIRPIHEKFPELSIVWLMFGEGDMLTDDSSVSKTDSEKEKKSLKDPMKPHNSNTSTPLNESNGEARTTPYFNELSDNEYDSLRGGEPITYPNLSHDALANNTFHYQEELISRNHRHPESNKILRKVKSIVVYYTDNTYETFSPDDVQPMKP